MRRSLARPKQIDLAGRLEALQTVVRIGEGRLPEGDLSAARRLLDSAGERLSYGAEATVVALAGATGSGKSSLFNSFTSAQLSQVGVRRPTTSEATAAIWGDMEVDGLLDWLEIGRRHRMAVDEPHGLILLDLPDHDSTQAAHRAEVDRLVERVDVFVWVVDPQKYADALLHDAYLRPLATHAPVTLVLLNQIDRLPFEDRHACVNDLSRLLVEDGLEHVSVLATSATTGLGMPELRTLIAARVAEKRAAGERLAADIEALLNRLQPFCEGGAVQSLSRSEREHLIGAFTEASGAASVADAVARSHRREAALATGWPFTRWLRRFRPDPLARLHLGSNAGGRTSRTTSSAHRAQVEIATRETVGRAVEGMREPWPNVVRSKVTRSTDEVIDDLDKAVSSTDLGSSRSPRWWGFVGALQKLSAFVAVLGFIWLTVLFALEWFQVPRPPTPEIESFPWPTVMLLGGLILGFAFAWLSRWFARVGAARRRKRAYTAIARNVHNVADEHVFGPLEREQSAYSELCEALTVMRL